MSLLITRQSQSEERKLEKEVPPPVDRRLSLDYAQRFSVRTVIHSFASKVVVKNEPFLLTLCQIAEQKLNALHRYGYIGMHLQLNANVFIQIRTTASQLDSRPLDSAPFNDLRLIPHRPIPIWV